MFEAVESTGRLDLLKQIASFFLSTILHALAIILLVILPLVYFNALPEWNLITFVIAPPPPPAYIPPPFSPPPAMNSMAVAPSRIAASIDFAPIAVPRGIPVPDPRDLEIPFPNAIPTGAFSGSGYQGGIPGAGLPGIIGTIPQSPPLASIPKPARPKALQRGGNVLDGKVLKKTEPLYPQIARIARISGTVVLQIHIDEEGNVEAVDVLTGHPLLVGAAVSAVRQWKYSPTLLNGEPVPVIGTVTVIFNLR